jgi:hypothetical protein
MPLTLVLPAFSPAACPFRLDCPGGAAARPVIVGIAQPICCGFHMKGETIAVMPRPPNA